MHTVRSCLWAASVCCAPAGLCYVDGCADGSAALCCRPLGASVHEARPVDFIGYDVTGGEIEYQILEPMGANTTHLKACRPPLARTGCLTGAVAMRVCWGRVWLNNLLTGFGGLGMRDACWCQFRVACQVH